MKQLIKKILISIGVWPKPPSPEQIKLQKISNYIANGRQPWSHGYVEYKEEEIVKAINSPEILSNFSSGKIPSNYGIGIDERVVEYAWILSNLANGQTRMLDAGSTFNFEYLVEHPIIQKKELSIYTYHPEGNCFFDKRISYVYGDLRELPYREGCFDEIVCQSTIEHIDMDNSIYGYELPSNENHQEKSKSYDYIKVLEECHRVLKSQGVFLLTFPFGRFENHGFFQQFDNEMLQRIIKFLGETGKVELDFIRYKKTGWEFSTQEECQDLYSYNPHTGRGKGDDGAAHSRSVCCLKYVKN